MILVLGLVIALLYGFFWLLKRFSSVKSEGEEAFHILSTRPLKGDAAIHLVEIGNRLLLIGSSGSAVNLITEIEDKETMDEIRLQASRTRAQRGGFLNLLKKKIGPDALNSEEQKIGDPGVFLRKQRERLKNL